jgi:hypothetical protein
VSAIKGSATARADQFLSAADADTVEAQSPLTDAANVDLNGRAGLFLNEPTGEPLHLVVNNSELRIPGLRAALVPVAADRFRNPSGELFFRSQDQFEIHFLSPDQFELKSMKGKTTRYRRAQPYTPTAAAGDHQDRRLVGEVLPARQVDEAGQGGGAGELRV